MNWNAGAFLGFAALVVLSAVPLLAPEEARAKDPSIEEELDSLKREMEAGRDAGADSDAGASERDGDDLRDGEERAGGDSGSIDRRIRDLQREIEGSESGETDTVAREDETEPRDGDETEAGSAQESSAADAGFWANWELYRDPLLCGFIAGAILGLLGVYVVSRRIVFVSAALSQVSALGVTLGFFIVGAGAVVGALQYWIPPALAVVLSLLVVFALVRAGDDPSFPRDAVLGTAFVVPMALVLVLGPYIPQEMHEIRSILHGSAVVVRTSDLWAVGIAGALVLVAQLVAFRGFVFASLDPKVARTQGLPVGALEAVLFGSIALMTGLVTRALGALPAFALTVLPAIGAVRLKIGLSRVFVVAATLGGLSGAVGYWLAYHFGWSVGASQTLLAAAAMVIVRAVGAIHDRYAGRRSSP